MADYVLKKKMENEVIISKVSELVAPLLQSRHVELVELTCRSEGSRVILRFLVDTARGITVEDLGALNRAIGNLLEEHDVIPAAYLLEVSSPGLDRPLKKTADFERVIGRRLRVVTGSLVCGKAEQTGELLSAGEEAIFVRSDNGEKIKILMSQIVKAVQEIKL